MTEIKDSGSRTDFGTGSVRDVQEGKGRFDLMPWMTLWALAVHFEKGCIKYGDRNWEKGQPVSAYFNSAMRHMIKHLLGLQDENHLVAAIWNLVCMYETEIRVAEGMLPAELSDTPKTYKAYQDVADLITPYQAHVDFNAGRCDVKTEGLSGAETGTHTEAEDS